MKSIIKIFILLLLFSNYSTSQIINKTAQVLVRGTISDKIDNTPIGVEVRFEDPTGKYFKINSNSLTGKFEQILSSGTQYKVRLFSNNIFPTEFILTTPEVTVYTEIEQNYQVIKLNPGRTVLTYDLFDKGKSELTSDSVTAKFIDELNIKMRFNRNVKVKIEVLGTDSKEYFNKTTEKKVKKKKISEVTFDKHNYESLVDKRFSIVNDLKNKFLSTDRITISYNKSSELSDEILLTCPNCDIRIVVTEFDPTLK